MLNGWQSQFKGKINFLLVYIAEAHAKNVWPLGNHVVLESHKCIDDRQKAARMFLERGCEIPIVLDTMADEFDKQYAVWPERFFLTKNNSLISVYYPKIEFGFDMEAINLSLQTFVDGKELVDSVAVVDNGAVIIDNRGAVVEKV